MFCVSVSLHFNARLEILDPHISHSEYLVRNRVQAADQQDLIVQCVKCVLYKSGVCISQVLRVYCTRCEDCIVQGVDCVLYRVFSVYFISKSSVNKVDFDIKSDWNTLFF